jgi:hypothetical protein
MVASTPQVRAEIKTSIPHEKPSERLTPILTKMAAPTVAIVDLQGFLAIVNSLKCGKSRSPAPRDLRRVKRAS